jgi:hypothetical protein
MLESVGTYGWFGGSEERLTQVATYGWFDPGVVQPILSPVLIYQSFQVTLLVESEVEIG